MSNFPISLDDDTTLPPVNNNIVEIGDEAINALRDAVFNTEQEIGLGASGTTGSIANRLAVSLDVDGSIKPSAITSLGLVTLPITNSQIASDAAILESKLRLDYRTADLFNYIRENAGNINTLLGWLSLSGSKLEPHIAGTAYQHSLSQLRVSVSSSSYLNNKFNVNRDNSSVYAVMSDINAELLHHQFADGSSADEQLVTTYDGSTYPAKYAHTAGGIFARPLILKLYYFLLQLIPHT